MNIKNGKIWPYAIGISIMLVFSACILTIVVANKLPVEKSDTYMMGYHEADANANELIKARIDFDKKYKIEYITDGLSIDNSIFKYRVTTQSGDAVDDAEILVIVTRPNNHKHDQELIKPSVESGIYTFSSVTLPVEGRWDVMAKVKVGNSQRFFNVKADTRSYDAYEY